MPHTLGNGLMLGYSMLGLAGGPLIIASGAAVVLGVIEAGTVWQAVATIPEFFWELSLGIWLTAKGFNKSAVASLSAEPADVVLNGGVDQPAVVPSNG